VLYSPLRAFLPPALSVAAAAYLEEKQVLWFPLRVTGLVRRAFARDTPLPRTPAATIIRARYASQFWGHGAAELFLLNMKLTKLGASQALTLRPRQSSSLDLPLRLNAVFVARPKHSVFGVSQRNVSLPPEFVSDVLHS